MERLHPDSFSWSRWRRGTLIWEHLKIPCRHYFIVREAKILRKYVVGWLEGDRLVCRPKKDKIAVMFLINNTFCWTHLRKEEFYAVFK
uniref:Uncharacterized protein n=1 Tax=viral metagenome TaxID=1070528 RepID=A0A6M3LX03_9ZZZZ